MWRAVRSGGAPRGKVKLSKPIVSTDEKQAADKGAQIGQALKKGALSPEAKAELAHLLQKRHVLLVPHHYAPRA
jgi:hypothetical protein